MTDALPDWDEEPSPFAPDAGQQARGIALCNACADDTPENFERAVLDYCRDILRDDTAPAALWALVSYGAQSLLACQGRALTLARLRQDLSVAREAALEEEQ